MNKLDPNEFMRLEKGSNIFRAISKPYVYRAHRIKNVIKKCLKTSSFHCALCSEHGQAPGILLDNLQTKKQQSRWLLGVIDRKVGVGESALERIKIVDFPVAAFYSIQQLSRDEDWGDPVNYDLDFRMDPDAGEHGIYTIIPRPMRPLTEEDEKLASIFVTMNYSKLMEDFCNPVNVQEHGRDWHMMDVGNVTVAYGVTCGSCSKYYSYAVRSSGFNCWACRNGW